MKIIILITPLMSMAVAFFVLIGSSLSQMLDLICCKFFKNKVLIQSQCQRSCGGLECRVELQETPKKLFKVFIKGQIIAPVSKPDINITLRIADITETDPLTKTVLSSNSLTRHPITGEFIIDQNKGSLPAARFEINDWMEIASFETAWLTVARKGMRKLQFTAAVCLASSKAQLAAASTETYYPNESCGYIENAYNELKARRLGTSLALYLVASSGEITLEHIAKITDWFNQAWGQLPGWMNKPGPEHIQKAINSAAKFFTKTKHLDAQALCSELCAISAHSTRLDVIKLCLELAVNQDQLALGNRFAFMLEIEHSSYLGQLEKTLVRIDTTSYPPEMLLGISPEMNFEQIRKLLNHQYSRWNSRVTSLDPVVRDRALAMIDIITTMRSQCRPVPAAN